jgi:membrane protease subunit HflC
MVRAGAEEEKARILGKAVEVSQKRRGEGEGDAARIYGEALSQAPDFYGFVRTMETSHSFVRKGTTVVLPADSPLFGLLFDSSYFNGSTAAHNGGTRKGVPQK